MPNWCQNVVYIEASPEEIEQIIASINNPADDKGLLNYFRPEPEHAEVAQGTMPSWWTWRVENWGTKWEVQAEIVSHSVEGGWINLIFDSAWAPPIDAISFWADQKDERVCNLRYMEWGMMFCGEYDSQGEHDYYDIPETVQLAEQLIPVELDEEFGILESMTQWEEEQAQELEGA